MQKWFSLLKPRLILSYNLKIGRKGSTTKRLQSANRNWIVQNNRKCYGAKKIADLKKRIVRLEAKIGG